MLKNRIISTLKYFDLQDLPLTLFELHKFLLADIADIKAHLDKDWAIKTAAGSPAGWACGIDEVGECLQSQCQAEVGCLYGYYFLSGRQPLVELRLRNYEFGLLREKLIWKFAGFCRFLPFVRGVALGGSQALGLNKPGSDIDLFIVTDPQFFWLGRTFLTAYFQMLGRRRHGQKIANRFCLNHYVAGPRPLARSLDLYQGTDIVKFRTLLGGKEILAFQSANAPWVRVFFPNFAPANAWPEPASRLQRMLEAMFTNSFGRKLENFLAGWQMKRIHRGEYITAEAGEISFHSQQKKHLLFAALFE